jgi:hypothetical protein
LAGEKTLAKPLSGSEIVEAILFRIRERLGKDCFLAPHIAYGSFSFQAEIRVQFQNTGTAIKETFVRANDQGGDVTEAEMRSFDVTVTDEPKAPNEVRVETGQGVPTIVTKPQGGIEEKRVKYDPKNLPKQGAKKALAGSGR